MPRKRKQPPAPPLPAIEYAMARAQANADSSMLPQWPYADYIPGFGWIVDSIANGGSLPSNAKHAYLVSVLPARYFNGWETVTEVSHVS